MREGRGLRDEQDAPPGAAGHREHDRSLSIVRQALRTALIDAQIAVRNVVRHGRRSLGGGLAVMFGTVALILAGGFIEWIFWGMREGTIHSGLGHIQVVRTGYREHGAADPFGYLLPAEAAVRRPIEALDGVIKLAPRLKFTGLISRGDASLSFLGAGVVPQLEGGADSVTHLQGKALSEAEPEGVLLGRGLAESLRARIGDRVVLLVQTRGGSLNGVEARVRGIFATVTKAYDDVAVHVPFALADEILRANGAHAWVLYLSDTALTGPVMRQLQGLLGAQLTAIPWYEAADFYNKTVRLFSRQVLVMKLIIALVVVLSISNTMIMNVMQRIEEIATTMALGLRRRRVLARFLMEGTMLALLGGAIGIALGLALAIAISAIGIPMPPPPGMAQGFVGQILVTPALVRDAFILAGVTGLVASLYPAWKASRMVIADALRHGR